jgi:hypothetical protein
MFVPTIPISLTALPAAAIVAVGILGAFSARLLRRTDLTMLEHVKSQDAIPSLFIDAPSSAGDSWDDEVGELDAKAAAVQLLDRWCERPRSAWRALGSRALLAARAEARAYTASQVVLEGMLTHHVPPMDAWLVRDFANTAWFSAPEDGAPSSSAVEMAARRAVTNGALALLARAWLPGEDFERLAVMVVR